MFCCFFVYIVTKMVDKCRTEEKHLMRQSCVIILHIKELSILRWRREDDCPKPTSCFYTYVHKRAKPEHSVTAENLREPSTSVQNCKRKIQTGWGSNAVPLLSSRAHCQLRHARGNIKASSAVWVHRDHPLGPPVSTSMTLCFEATRMHGTFSSRLTL